MKNGGFSFPPAAAVRRLGQPDIARHVHRTACISSFL
jgi:hypothetical protein